MNDRLKNFNSGRAIFFLLMLIAVVIGAAVLKIAAGVLLIFTIALLLAFVMKPFVEVLVKVHVPRVFAILIAVCIIMVGLFGAGLVLYSSGQTILSVYPKYESRLTEIYEAAAGLFDLSYDEQLSVIQNLWGQLGIRNSIRGFTFSFTNNFISFSKDAVMVVLFTVFMLIESTYFMEKLDMTFSKDTFPFRKISTDVVKQVSRYLTAKFFISLATGVVVYIGLGAIGLEFALLWGVIQFIMNFIPSLGSIAAGVGTTFFALIQFWPNPGPIIGVAAVMLGTNTIIGSVLDPMIMGDTVGLSPIVVLVS
ncbi:AI-2E family transporter, partial [Breznakiellaceae bacterium SP9]